MRRLTLRQSQELAPLVYRVVGLEALASEWEPGLRMAALVQEESEQGVVERLQEAGLTDVAWLDSPELQPGDIIVPHGRNQQVSVLYRESDMHHSLQLTNRCNSYCLMCSQPPTPQEDSWLVDEALEVVAHLRESPPVFGLSGGEPLLLGKGLRQVLDAFALRHPSTKVEVLTNGRLLSRSDIVEDLLRGPPKNVSWLVPLYGHADFVHDFVVQAPGAFEETVAGLLTLQERGQPVQLRIVLIEPVLRILPELCGFIGRNLPFVREVAFMACEPIGFALANREQCEVDLAQWSSTLEEGAKVLGRHEIPYLIMNTPLCALPRWMWRHAHRSISDWKNVYASECAKCAVKEECSGLFAWHERGWKPTSIRAIKGVNS